jgi:parallel beta-helix repeat protein
MTRKSLSGIILGLLLICASMLVFSIEPSSQTSVILEDYDLSATDVLPMSASAEVSFDPQTYTFIAERGIGPGTRFNTTIELYDVTWLFAWQVRAYFNNTLLNATNAYYHPDEPIHKVSHIPLTPVIDNDYNATHGYVQHYISAIYPNYVNVTTEDYPLGAGICIMEFEILIKPSSKQTLSSVLSLDNLDTRLRKDPSTIIPTTKKNGLYRLISATIRVPTDYSTIQEAVNAAEPGNTVFVYNGTYHENIVVNKTLTLIGQDSRAVVVGGIGGTVLYGYSSADLVIDGFTLQGGQYGVRITKSARVTVSNNNITSNSVYGIYVDSGTGNSDSLSIWKNNITANGNGGVSIFTQGDYRSCSGGYIYENSIEQNGGHAISARAVYLAGCGGWRVYRNDMTTNNGYGIEAISDNTGGGGCQGWLVLQNNFTANRGGVHCLGISTYFATRCYYWNVQRNIFSDNNGTGIFVDSLADFWELSDNILVGNTQGIYVLGGSTILRRNNMTDNTYNFGMMDREQNIDTSNTVNGKPLYYLVDLQGGEIPLDAGYLALIDSANVIVRNCSLSHNRQGVMLIRSENITLENISVTNNMYGIYLRETSNLTVYNNQVSNNTYGVYLQGSINGTISHNRAINNTYGVYFKSSTNCNVTANNAEENEYGIYMSLSSNNRIYHNSFNQNTQQAAVDTTSTNAWDDGYPSAGNHWSDSTGPDWCRGIYQNETGSDGIVDAKVIINQNNIDHYPFSAPWSSPIHIILPGNAIYRGSNITACAPYQTTYLNFTIDFKASWIGYSLEDQANVTITGNTTLTNLSYGWHHIIVYANDTSGNMWSSVKVRFAITFITDINYDRTVDIDDLVETTWRYGSIPGDVRWNIYADVNQDGIIDVEDIAMVVGDCGKTW